MRGSSASNPEELDRNRTSSNVTDTLASGPPVKDPPAGSPALPQRAEPVESESLEEENECAICFGTITESTALPCSCKVPYCARCWDRALANSFSSCGQARCPTCRSPVRVDFDASSGKLVFSSETECLTSEDVTESPQRFMAASDRARARLTEQALPAQIRILQSYGSSHTFLKGIAEDPQEELGNFSISALKQHIVSLGGSTTGCVEKADLVVRLVNSVGSSRSLASYWASVCAEGPLCVCGSNLKRVSGSERARLFCEKLMPGASQGSPQFELAYSRLTRNGKCGIVCDICENKEIYLTSSMWTCENGSETILHATAYDICDHCFLNHAVGTAGKDD